MTRFSDLPISARLGAAFGLLTLSLVLVSAIALHAFGTLRADTNDIARRDVRAAALGGGFGRDVEQITRLTAEHLYVHDGELGVEDGLAKRIAAREKSARASAAQLKPLVRGTQAEQLMKPLEAAAGSFEQMVQVALARSRAETVSGADDRSGSRDLYTSKLTPQAEKLSLATDQLQAALDRTAGASAEDAASSASASGRLLLIVMLVAAALALAFAVLITRSVVRPVRGLAERLQDLDEHCLSELTAGLEAAAAGDFTREANAVTDAAGHHVRRRAGPSRQDLQRDARQGRPQPSRIRRDAR